MKEVTMLSPGFVYSFLDKQLKTSIQVSRWGGGREILGRGLWLRSLNNYTSEFLFCLPSAQDPEKWIKLQGIMQVKMLDLAQKTKWQSLQNSLHFHNIVSIKKMIDVVTMLTNKSWWCVNNNTSSSSLLFPPLPPSSFLSSSSSFITVTTTTINIIILLLVIIRFTKPLFHIMSPKVFYLNLRLEKQ